jgi:protein-tyrosine phosphatase
MPAILFVCTANICRSPMAEGVFRKLLRDRGAVEGFELDSASTHEFRSGEPPAPAAVDAAAKRGYDITTCVSRRIGGEDYDHFDMILAMDRSNVARLRAIAPTRSKQKIELLTEYSEAFHGKDIADPFGRASTEYEIALDMIEDACKGLAGVLVGFSRAASK